MSVCPRWKRKRRQRERAAAMREKKRAYHEAARSLSRPSTAATSETVWSSTGSELPISVTSGPATCLSAPSVLLSSSTASLQQMIKKMHSSDLISEWERESETWSLLQLQQWGSWIWPSNCSWWLGHEFAIVWSEDAGCNAFHHDPKAVQFHLYSSCIGVSADYWVQWEDHSWL